MSNFILTFFFWSLSIKFVACTSPSVPPLGNQVDEPSMIEVVGFIKTGIMAIGGETTGITLTTQSNETYDLIMRDRIYTEVPHPKKVLVKGKLKRIFGIARPLRRAIEVISIESAQ